MKYICKNQQHQSGECVGGDEEGNLYKGIVSLMVVGFKLSIPFIVQAISEVTFNGEWLAETFSDNIDNLIEFGLCVRGIVTDNYLAIVNAFSVLIKITL